MQPASHAIGKPSHPCTFLAPNSARPALASTRVSWVRSFIHSWRGLCQDASWPSGLWLSDYPLLRSLSIFEVQVCWILNCAWFSWQFGDAQQDPTGLRGMFSIVAIPGLDSGSCLLHCWSLAKARGHSGYAHSGRFDAEGLPQMD